MGILLCPCLGLLLYVLTIQQPRPAGGEHLGDSRYSVGMEMVIRKQKNGYPKYPNPFPALGTKAWLHLTMQQSRL